MDSSKNQTKSADLTIRIRPDLKARLEAAKQSKDRSVAWLVERCIEAHLPVLETQEPEFGAQSSDLARANHPQQRQQKRRRLPSLRQRKSAAT